VHLVTYLVLHQDPGVHPIIDKCPFRSFVNKVIKSLIKPYPQINHSLNPKYDQKRSSGRNKFGCSQQLVIPFWWLLSPLMVYQNYHLIHHFYPTVPFYRMHAMWYLKYDELSAGNVSYQQSFRMVPGNMPSPLNYH